MNNCLIDKWNTKIPKGHTIYSTSKYITYSSFICRTSFFSVHRDETREQNMITQNRQTKKLCTGDKISHVIGMELCAEISYPNASLKTDAPYFPLTGPISGGVTLYKRDSHTSYKMEYKFVKVIVLIPLIIDSSLVGKKNMFSILRHFFFLIFE